MTTKDDKVMRSFDTGATRDTADGKVDMEGFTHPMVERQYAKFMNMNRLQSDGKLRDSDNWQKGIPMDVYIKSLRRHHDDVWLEHRGFRSESGTIAALCGLIFNAKGYLLELLKESNFELQDFDGDQPTPEIRKRQDALKETKPTQQLIDYVPEYGPSPNEAMAKIESVITKPIIDSMHLWLNTTVSPEEFAISEYDEALKESELTTKDSELTFCGDTEVSDRCETCTPQCHNHGQVPDDDDDDDYDVNDCTLCRYFPYPMHKFPCKMCDEISAGVGISYYDEVAEVVDAEVIEEDEDPSCYTCQSHDVSWFHEPCSSCSVNEACCLLSIHLRSNNYRRGE